MEFVGFILLMVISGLAAIGTALGITTVAGATAAGTGLAGLATAFGLAAAAS